MSIRDWISLGNETKFEFSNGNTLKLNNRNMTGFQKVWSPFRASFF